MAEQQEIKELSEDMELMGPGTLLKDARKLMKLSVEDVASRLNFTVSMVKNIEADKFDDNLPATFTRGYLKNYAKLVNVPEQDVLSSFDMLGVAKSQRAEMQSFSRITKKQAENSRLMWITYLVLLLMLASTVIWWLQDSKNNNVAANNEAQAVIPQIKPVAKPKLSDNSKQTTSDNAANVVTEPSADNTENQTTETVDNLAEQAMPVVEQTATDTVSDSNKAAEQNINTALNHKVTVQFQFSGDCWVNIYDATGERLAWGIKKQDYLMTIDGVPPLKVTLGKPDLVTISYNGNPVDMSQFTAGNIARFTLPLQP